MSALAKLYQLLVILDEDLAHTAVFEGHELAIKYPPEGCTDGQWDLRFEPKATAEALKYDERQGCWYINDLVLDEKLASRMIGVRASKWLLDRWDKLTKEELNDACHEDTLARLRAVESAMKRLANK